MVRCEFTHVNAYNMKLTGMPKVKIEPFTESNENVYGGKIHTVLWETLAGENIG